VIATTVLGNKQQRYVATLFKGTDYHVVTAQATHFYKTSLLFYCIFHKNFIWMENHIEIAEL